MTNQNIKPKKHGMKLNLMATSYEELLCDDVLYHVTSIYSMAKQQAVL